MKDMNHHCHHVMVCIVLHGRMYTVIIQDAHGVSVIYVIHDVVNMIRIGQEIIIVVFNVKDDLNQVSILVHSHFSSLSSLPTLKK
jgi:3-oxoacyl-(acyl-carrier-protein) synthase